MITDPKMQRTLPIYFQFDTPTEKNQIEKAIAAFLKLKKMTPIEEKGGFKKAYKFDAAPEKVWRLLVDDNWGLLFLDEEKEEMILSMALTMSQAFNEWYFPLVNNVMRLIDLTRDGGIEGGLYTRA